MNRLEALIAENERWVMHMQQQRALQQAHIAAAANGVQPGSTDLVQAAVTDPSVTPQNFRSWLRSKLPSLSVETKEMLVHALGVLFLAAFNAAAQNAISRDEAERVNQKWLDAILDAQVPGVRGLLGGENVPELAPCCDDDESVVDAVFAKVERTERKTGGR
jgi:hypothetical protein